MTLNAFALLWLLGTSVDPALARQRMAEADGNMERKRFQDALAAYEEAVSGLPDSAEANFKIAKAYASLGFYPEAVDKWTKAKELSSDPAIQKSAQENIDRARARMVEAEIPPAVASPNRTLAKKAYEDGVQRLARQDYQGALAQLTFALRQDPGAAAPFVARGSALVALRRYPEAVRDYRQALRLDPQLASPHYGLGEAFAAMGQASEARESFEKYAASASADAQPKLQAAAKVKAQGLSPVPSSSAGAGGSE